MALKIRLRRMGRKKAPTYRIVVAESTMPRDGRFVATLGHYNPRTQPTTLVVDRDRTLAWLERGAKPTDTVESLLKKAGVYNPESAVEVAAETVQSVAKKTAQAAKKAVAKAVDAVQDAAEDVVEAVTGRGDEEQAPAEASEPASEAERAE